MLWKSPLSEKSLECVYSVKWYLNDKFSFLFFVFATLSSGSLLIMTLFNVCLSTNKISLREEVDCGGLFL